VGGESRDTFDLKLTGKGEMGKESKLSDPGARQARAQRFDRRAGRPVVRLKRKGNEREGKEEERKGGEVGEWGRQKMGPDRRFFHRRWKEKKKRRRGSRLLSAYHGISRPEKVAGGSRGESVESQGKGGKVLLFFIRFQNVIQAKH